MNRYQIHYRNVLERDLYSKLLSGSPFNLPKLDSITLHMSFLGNNRTPLNTRRFFLPAYIALELLTGQKPKLIEAKESVAALSLREGDFCGLAVKLRKGPMYQFLDSLVNVVLPSMGSMDHLLETSFDKQGNFSMKVQNLLFFPQLEKEYQHFHPVTGGSDATAGIKTSEKKSDFNTYLPVEINFALKTQYLKNHKNNIVSLCDAMCTFDKNFSGTVGKSVATENLSLEASKLFLKSLHLPFAAKASLLYSVSPATLFTVPSFRRIFFVPKELKFTMKRDDFLAKSSLFFFHSFWGQKKTKARSACSSIG
jgi:large subunit ribosomal protein L5